MGLIDRGKVMSDYLENLGRADSYKAKYEALANAIDDAPTIDAEPVRHGLWEDNKGAIRCSECKNTPLYDYHGRMVLATRCHVCGAMMRKEVRK